MYSAREKKRSHPHHVYQVRGMSFAVLSIIVYLRSLALALFLCMCVPLILGEARKSAGTCQCLMMYCYVAGVQGA